MKKIKASFAKNMWSVPIVFSMLGGGIAGLCFITPYYIEEGVVVALLLGVVYGVLGIGGFVLFPVALTVTEVAMLLCIRKFPGLHARGRGIDIITAGFGLAGTLIYMYIMLNVEFGKDWDEQLVNARVRTPVNTHAVFTVIAVMAVAAAGYVLVNFLRLERTPPLVLVIGISGMYLGCVLAVVWAVQITEKLSSIWDRCILLLPADVVLIVMRSVIAKVCEWNAIQHSQERGYQSTWAAWCNRFLAKSGRWPLAALVLMWPLLGILILALCFLGQEPDAIIKAWTETGGWTLSQQISPPNIYVDEHYLCTVAASGHKRLVRPLRTGVRHGHPVIVNRQLCIANAFEQVLEERMPRFHRAVRKFYDTCGFPVARKIRTKAAADVVYCLMKPLEGLFLTVLYLVDVHPEDRIAIQYTDRRLSDFRTGRV